MDIGMVHSNIYCEDSDDVALDCEQCEEQPQDYVGAVQHGAYCQACGGRGHTANVCANNKTSNLGKGGAGPKGKGGNKGFQPTKGGGKSAGKG